MENNNYEIDYSGQQPKQTGGPSIPPELDTAKTRGVTPYPKAKWRLPSVVTSSAFVVLGFGGFYAIEMMAPLPLKPSFWSGVYQSQVEGRVQATKLELQLKVDQANAAIKLHNDQEQEQYRMQTQIVGEFYRNLWERNKIILQANIRLTEQKRGIEYAQMQQFQSADMGVANFAQTWGRILNALSPSAGDSALEYSNDRKREMMAELSAIANNSDPVNIAEWEEPMPTPDQMIEMLEKLRPVPMPLLPDIGDDIAIKDENSGL